MYKSIVLAYDGSESGRQALMDCKEITKYARTHGANLIVVGHQHLNSWAARWWSGAISGDLIAHAHCSVLCVITH